MMMSEKTKMYVFAILRIALGGVFLFSGYMKAMDVQSLATIINKLPYISYDHSFMVALTVIGMEMVLGLFLILGLYSNLALKSSVILLVFFTAFLSYIIILKLDTGCGCFGSASNKSVSYTDILRNTLLILIGILLIRKKENIKRFSFDN
jgi:uncharacterized membrane protein YphA (DoxX/SURF4 family)